MGGTRLNPGNVGAALGIIVLVLLVLWAPVLDDASWFLVWSDAAHAIVFGAVCFLSLFALRHSSVNARLPASSHYLIALAVTIALGLATELIQIPLNRDASFGDVARDVIGAWIGAGIFALFDGRLSRRATIALAVTATIPGIIVAMPVVENSAAYLRRSFAFPDIANFSADFDDYFVRRQAVDLSHDILPATWSRSDREHALHIGFGDNRWPGLEFREPPPNWSDYRILALDITNPDKRELELQLRVHDEKHDQSYSDRFNLTLTIPGGERIVNRIPLELVEDGPRSRKLDLEEVSALILFVDGSLESNREIYLSGIWLE